MPLGPVTGHGAVAARAACALDWVAPAAQSQGSQVHHDQPLLEVGLSQSESMVLLLRSLMQGSAIAVLFMWPIQFPGARVDGHLKARLVRDAPACSLVKLIMRLERGQSNGVPRCLHDVNANRAGHDT